MNDKQPGDAAAQTTRGGGVSMNESRHAETNKDTDSPTAALGPAPSRPWFGGLILTCLTLAAVWVLTYTLAPLPGQRTLGGWNYVVVGALLTGFIWLSKAWRGEESQRP